VLDVVHDADRRLATIADRQGRVIAGLSEGGYGALNIALHHLGTFSGAQSWSGYFRQTPTQSFTGASRAALQANSPLVEVPRRARTIRHLGFRAWVYQGLSDPARPSDERQFVRVLAGAGAAVHYGFFPGGHDWGLWRAQVPRMLVAASHWFASPAGRTRPELVRVGVTPGARSGRAGRRAAPARSDAGGGPAPARR
jgi:enterochelin esterase-like enzyme